MTSTAQRMVSLEHAQQIRLARSKLRRAIVRGELSLATVLLAPPVEAHGWLIGEALMVEPQWGLARTRRLLGRLNISPLKPIGEMTERQRRQLARAIS